MSFTPPIDHLLLAATFSVSVAVAAAPDLGAARARPGVESIQIARRFGWTIRLPAGRLMSIWTEGKKLAEATADTESVEKAYARDSSDNGYTWSEPKLLFEFPKGAGSYHGAAVLCDRDGVIHLSGIHYFSRKKSLAFHVMSPDNGATWTPPQHCDFGHPYTGSTNSAIQLRSGRLVLPLSYLPGVKGRWADSVVSLSDDGGRTWRPGRQGVAPVARHHAEPVCIELKDGRVWMLIRTGDGHQFECHSSDGCETWTKSKPSCFVSPSSPAGLLRLRDGRLVVAWTNSLKPRHTLDRLVLAMAISSDDGETWQGYREVGRVEDGRLSERYPWLTETSDGAILLTYLRGSQMNLRRVAPDWLTETTFQDDFSQGLANWSCSVPEGWRKPWFDYVKKYKRNIEEERKKHSFQCDGATVIAHPDRPDHRALKLAKPKAQVASGASLNFPFGRRGKLTMRVLLPSGFQGTRVCLTDHFTWPYYDEAGAFAFSIGADGRIGARVKAEEFRSTDAVLESGKWRAIGLDWDCEKGTCGLTVDNHHVADLPQLSDAPGVCYVRLLSAAEQTDLAGLIVDSVRVDSK